MKKIPLMILIFWPLLILSQKAIINPGAETITLDKEKSIDVAKIIKNEEQLRDRVEFLEAQLIKLNDSINAAAVQLENSFQKLMRFAEIRQEQQTQINALNQRGLDIVTKSKNNNGLYAFSTVSGIPKGVKNLDVGLSYASSKILYMVGVDLMQEDLPIKIGLGFKLF